MLLPWDQAERDCATRAVGDDEDILEDEEEEFIRFIRVSVLDPFPGCWDATLNEMDQRLYVIGQSTNVALWSNLIVKI